MGMGSLGSAVYVLLALLQCFLVLSVTTHVRHLTLEGCTGTGVGDITSQVLTQTLSNYHTFHSASL